MSKKNKKECKDFYTTYADSRHQGVILKNNGDPIDMTVIQLEEDITYYLTGNGGLDLESAEVGEERDKFMKEVFDGKLGNQAEVEEALLNYFIQTGSQ